MLFFLQGILATQIHCIYHDIKKMYSTATLATFEHTLANNDLILELSANTTVNLDPGKYKLRVKASNNDGVWSESSTELPIVVKQYWYKSSLAIILYAICFSVALFILLRIYYERSNLKKAITIEKIEK